MNNCIELIGEELAKASRLQKREKQSEEIGMFVVKTANQTLQEAALRADPTPLWDSLWYEGEICCLFSDSNLGKSIYGVQIATSIAKSQKVLYFDFELSDKQFQLRYTDKEGKLYRFPDNLYRVEINPHSLGSVDFEERVIFHIEQTAIESGAKVLIIDNLTYLCIASEKGEAAGILMNRLMALKKKHDLSILVLAHTPKRCLSNPITQNDLAGSKKLFNFFDSAFAIGKSAMEKDLRYIKQVKVRYGSYRYDSENVILASIEKTGSSLQFVGIGYGNEKEHLREHSDQELSQLAENIRELSSQGKSIRDMAKELGVSKSSIGRILNK